MEKEKESVKIKEKKYCAFVRVDMLIPVEPAAFYSVVLNEIKRKTFILTLTVLVFFF